ncbi:MAG: ATP-dependent sacrificial sulfur transferase LarE, partial [Candidatus Eremiobacteraeota bacterium]|nr:ATP-dependent sacrificial sulfur transferase LarE [Candidatus Eremiobacteraeota bacterium]
SGGVDSTFLAWRAARVLGPSSLAVTAVSASLAPADRERARNLAIDFDIPHLEMPTAELERPEYRQNGADRCFHCKTELFEGLAELARQRDFAVLCYGAIPEDQQDHRPGARAAALAGARAPLAEAGLTKPCIRRLSKEAGLPTYDLPAQACLASRIAYHTEVTGEKLALVASAEAFLRGLGFSECRVRHHQGLARIEVPRERLPELTEQADAVSGRLRELGFVYVTIDLMGLRSGSMNEILRLPVVG